MQLAWFDSPVGRLRLTADDNALTGVYFPGDNHPASASAPAGAAVPPVLRETTRQLKAYFAGRLRDFDLPLAPQGTTFQETVWQALRRIPYGATRSYGEIAAAIGCPTGSRAVGLANGRNPISIIIPCHRVIGANGKLTGYGGGLDRKAFLLKLEQPA